MQVAIAPGIGAARFTGVGAARLSAHLRDVRALFDGLTRAHELHEQLFCGRDPDQRQGHQHQPKTTHQPAPEASGDEVPGVAGGQHS